jgi:dynamin family protein
VAEEANCDNRLDVAMVQVFLPAPMLSKGIVLIDTPGIGSTLRHNTEATLGFLPQCDVALFVVSVDPPMTQAESEFLATVLGHVPHLAFVLNTIDQLEDHERPAVLGFLRNVLSEQTHVPPDVRIFTVSARQALQAKRTGNADLLARSGFDELETYLTDDLAHQKSGLLQAAIARKAAAVLSEGLMMLELALRSLQLPLADLEERMAAFERPVEDFERQRLTSKDLLAGDRTRVLEALEMRAERLRQEADRHLTGVMDRALAEATDGASAQDALGVDLPRFRGGVRAWVQGIWSDGILSSCLRLFFCSAPAEFVFPSRPARL